MHGGEDLNSLVKFKDESSRILESGKFPVHKWESNVKPYKIVLTYVEQTGGNYNSS